jgi:uncharacterized tellurite resistance protein B-like protein
MTATIEVMTEIDALLKNAPIRVNWEAVNSRKLATHDYSFTSSSLSDVAEETNHLDKRFMDLLKQRAYLVDSSDEVQV